MQMWHEHPCEQPTNNKKAKTMHYYTMWVQSTSPCSVDQ
jgi:hypothetical protein